MTNKIWSIRGKSDRVSDSELILMIKEHKVSFDDYITNNDLKTWLKVADTIYQFYLEDYNENL